MEGFIDCPIKVAICTGYEFIYLPLLEELRGMQEYIITSLNEADIVIIDQASMITAKSVPPSAIIIGVSGECYGNFPIPCDFEVGAHVTPKEGTETKAWLPYLPHINSYDCCPPLTYVPREKAWNRKDICWICSHDTPWRTNFVYALDAELLHYKIHVDYLGAVGPVKQRSTGTWRDVTSLISQYKCALAIENTIQDGYITEKIPNVLLARSVPITVRPLENHLFPFPDSQDWILRTPSTAGVITLARNINNVLSSKEAYLQMWDANPLLHSQFYQNYKTIRHGISRIAASIVEQWWQVKK